MSMITGNIKSLLQVKFKARHDNYTDQFNRIFMVKIAMVSSMLLGLNWFKENKKKTKIIKIKNTFCMQQNNITVTDTFLLFL